MGLVARSEDRGLGIQTWEVYRHLRPERTLLVDMGELARGFAQHPERYPDALRVAFAGGQLPEGPVREWLAGLDVVYAAETTYDWHLLRWADEAGVATVVHANPEFYRHDGNHGLPSPTAWWAATTWRLDTMPGARVVPMPVALDRFGSCFSTRDEGADTGSPVRLLHVAGHRAHMDRNGTTLLLQALRSVRRPLAVTIRGQDGRLPVGRSTRGVVVTNRPVGIDDYWRLYDDADVLVLPRRYGGLCLPTQEAMAAGLAVVMLDCEPNPQTWPIFPVPSRVENWFVATTGRVEVHGCRPHLLAQALDQLADEPHTVAALQARAREWAEAHSWEALLPTWRAELAAACR